MTIGSSTVSGPMLSARICVALLPYGYIVEHQLRNCIAFPLSQRASDHRAPQVPMTPERCWRPLLLSEGAAGNDTGEHRLKGP